MVCFVVLFATFGFGLFVCFLWYLVEVVLACLFCCLMITCGLGLINCAFWRALLGLLGFDCWC